jgi:hypothetical protein
MIAYLANDPQKAATLVRTATLPERSIGAWTTKHFSDSSKIARGPLTNGTIGNT